MLNAGKSCLDQQSSKNSIIGQDEEAIRHFSYNQFSIKWLSLKYLTVCNHVAKNRYWLGPRQLNIWGGAILNTLCSVNTGDLVIIKPNIVS